MYLRPHQEHGLSLLRESFRKLKVPRVMFAAPCSYGKTVISAHILKAYQDVGKRGIFICDRIKLVNQSLSAFDALGLNCSVIQSYHERFDSTKPVQIASIASLEKFHHWPDADIIMVDEAHVMRKSVIKMMTEWNNVPFIGLSATPYAKGLGEHYNDLIVPTTPEMLLDGGYLCPVNYYGGRKPDLRDAKTKSLSSGGTDWTQDSLAACVEQDEFLAGDIVKNWFDKAKGKMTIAFSPSVPHSKHMVDIFNGAGVSAIHIDGYMSKDQQDDIFEAHKNGEFLILSCSRLLNTGYDEPGIECLIDCYPTKSITQYVQRAGRIMRIKDGKDFAIYLDHAGNVRRHGFAETVVPDKLHCETQEYSERKLTKEKKEPRVRECPICYQEMQGRKCKCGYEIPEKEIIHTDDQNLELIKDGNNWNKKTRKADKESFYAMLKHYAAKQRKSPDWVDKTYKNRAGVWPDKKLKAIQPIQPDESFNKYIKHLRIKYAKSRNYRRNKTG